MQINLSAKHMRLTPALAAHAQQKLGQALMHIFDPPSARVRIALGSQDAPLKRPDKTCKVTVSMPKGRTVVICETEDDLYKAINLAHDRILERVKRERRKQVRLARTRKWARAQRHQTARQSLSAPPEPWEEEVRQYEGSIPRA